MGPLGSGSGMLRFEVRVPNQDSWFQIGTWFQVGIEPRGAGGSRGKGGGVKGRKG